MSDRPSMTKNAAFLVKIAFDQALGMIHACGKSDLHGETDTYGKPPSNEPATTE